LAIFDVIKYGAPNDSQLVWKHSGDKLKLGSQLIVTEGQVAIFVKSGQALDLFRPGTHTLSTGNLPFIEKVINLPFGGKTPFSAEVWFLNTTVKRDLKWGTPSPIPLSDPALGFVVSARAFGRWGIRIENPQSFITQIVGSQRGSDASVVDSFFTGIINQSLTVELGKKIGQGTVSILQIASILNELSSSTFSIIQEEMTRFGIQLVNFDIESINIPKEELERIQDVYAKTLEVRELSKVETGGAYSAVKSFEVLDNAAKNEGNNNVGSLLGAGIGLGAGLPIGQQIGQNLQVDAPGKDEKITPAAKLRELKALLEEGLITDEQFAAKRDEILETL